MCSLGPEMAPRCAPSRAGMSLQVPWLRVCPPHGSVLSSARAGSAAPGTLAARGRGAPAPAHTAEPQPRPGKRGLAWPQSGDGPALRPRQAAPLSGSARPLARPGPAQAAALPQHGAAPQLPRPPGPGDWGRQRWPGDGGRATGAGGRGPGADAVSPQGSDAPWPWR